MRTINYKGSIYVNPDAESLKSIGLSAEDAGEVMTQLASSEAQQRRDELLQVAAIRIAPLQDAQDLGAATNAEKARLLAWKRYRVDLNRIDQQESFPATVHWPEVPTE